MDGRSDHSSFIGIGETALKQTMILTMKRTLVVVVNIKNR